jgi:hypothetical protein
MGILQRIQDFLPLTGVSTLLLNFCNKKQEIEECLVKLCC